MATTLNFIDALAFDFITSPNAPQFETRNGHRIIAFDDSTEETAFARHVIPEIYEGGDLTVTIKWMAATATSGDTTWAVAFERHDDEATDLDTDSFAADQTVASTAPSTSGMVQYANIIFTAVQIDSLMAGEQFRLRLKRVAADGSDTMTGDAQALSVTIGQTGGIISSAVRMLGKLTGVDLKVLGDTPIATVPAGEEWIITHAWVRITSIVGASTTCQASIGIDSPFTNIFPNSTIFSGSVRVAGDYYGYPLNSQQTTDQLGGLATAGQTISFDVNFAMGTPTSVAATVYLFGFDVNQEAA